MSNRAQYHYKHNHLEDQDQDWEWGPNKNHNNKNPPKGDTNSLGIETIIFLGIAGGTAIIVLIVCVILWIRSARLKPDHRSPTQVVGRAIQRPSFFPFRLSRRQIDPEIIYCPSPDGSSINYPVQTPYTFGSTYSTDSQSGSPKPVRTASNPQRATVI